MVFCNTSDTNKNKLSTIVTILILIDGFLQYKQETIIKEDKEVTILILIDGFLQYNQTIRNAFRELKSQSLF